MKFYEEHKADRDKFEILAFHDNSVKTLAEMDQQLETKNIIKGRWGGKPLPFPILLDATDKTLKAFRIQGFPTMYLIDPKGNVVQMGHHGLEEVLAAKLKEKK